MYLDPNATYFRKDNILYQNDKPIVKFLTIKFIDVDKPQKDFLSYTERYMYTFPKYWEAYHEEIKANQQLNLFD